MILSILNIIFPGSALFWRKQTLQGICYVFAFGILCVFRHDIGALGALWAIYILIAAQIHFHKIRKIEIAKGFGKIGKVILWFATALILLLYSVMYGPSWTHGGEIKYPFLLYILVVVSLIIPAFLLTFWLKPKYKRTE